jgi:hypothetical protein
MASSISKDINHIVKFDGRNFPLWKLGCWLMLEQHNLIPVVDGSETIPNEVRQFHVCKIVYELITHVSNLRQWTQTV